MELEFTITKSQPNPQYTFETLHQLATAACQDIWEFKPDLVMVLAHGGWGLL